MAAKHSYDKRVSKWCVVVHHNKKKRTVYMESRDSAIQGAKEINDRLDRRKLGLLVNAGDSFKDFANEWHKENLALGTWKDSTALFYRSNLDTHLLPALGTVRVTQIDRDHCKNVVKAGRARGLSVKTVRGIVMTLSGVLSAAVERKLLSGNPAFRMGKYLKSPDAVPKQIEPYSREEVGRLLTAAETIAPEWHCFLLMAVRAGLRLGELLAVEWDDLDLVARRVWIERAFVKGKITSTKNKQTRRVDLSVELVAALRAWRVVLRKAALAAGEAQPALIFPAADFVSVRDAHLFRRKLWRRIQRKAELKRRRLHDLRHTFASLLLAENTPIIYVKDQLGHSSIQVTVDTYGHLLPNANRRHVDLLDGAATPPAAGETGETAETA